MKGGFNIRHHLNSTACVEKDRLGGLNLDGKQIAVNDQIAFNQQQQVQQKPVQLTFRFKPDYNLPITIRVIEGYQVKQFDKPSLRSFYTQKFTVEQDSNRMGYRLSGSTPVSPPIQPILSEGIALGSIQIPPDGEPIVLLNDRQTIGGYPKIGCVARMDLPSLPKQSLDNPYVLSAETYKKCRIRGVNGPTFLAIKASQKINCKQHGSIQRYN